MSTTTPAKLAAAYGYMPPDPTWQYDETRDFVPMLMWGKDHWSTFAYVECRIVDHAGMLEHDHMRTDADRHPLLMSAKRRALTANLTDKEYPTRLKATAVPDADGHFGIVVLPDHDDYDCLEDAIAAGLLTVVMPTADSSVFRDARGHVVHEVTGNTPIEPSFVTGMTEVDLMAKASWKLTELGQRVAGELRAHKGNRGNFHSFVPSVLTDNRKNTANA